MGDNGRMTFTVTLAGDAHSFVAEPGETLLDAARRAGLARAWRCRNGKCGSCRAWLQRGRVHTPAGEPLETDDAAEPVLLCQAQAASDLTLQPRTIRSVADVACRERALELVARKPLSSEVVQLEFRACDEASPLHWLPGQYLELCLPGSLQRPFSIANVDAGDGRMELHVRRVAHSDFNRQLFAELTPGQRVDVIGPLGSFIPRENAERPILFVAGGTGMAPIRAMIQHFLRLESGRPMQLYWGARRAEDLYLADRLQELTERLPLLQFVPAISDDPDAQLPGVFHGLVVDAVLADHTNLAGFDVYVCGPPAMVEAATEAFVAAGLPRTQLFTDNFRYAPEKLAEILDARAGLRVQSVRSACAD